jgi:hypothetical protein
LPIDKLRRRRRRIVRPFPMGMQPIRHGRDLGRRRELRRADILIVHFFGRAAALRVEIRIKSAGEDARATQPATSLLQLRYCDFQLELPFGVGIVSAADDNGLSQGKRRTAFNFDLANYGT